MEGNTLMGDGELDLIHNVVLELFRRGQSINNICILLNEELEKLGDASDYLKAIKESDFAP
jgi:hypothetical protein